MAPALEALKRMRYIDAKEMAMIRKPPIVMLKVAEAVCCLVGEEPGWVLAQKLFSRRDFLRFDHQVTCTDLHVN